MTFSRRGAACVLGLFASAFGFLGPVENAVRARSSLAPLRAVGVLQRKAKENEMRKYREGLADGDAVLAALDAAAAGTLAGREREGFGRVRSILKREPRGALRVVAEYHAKTPAALKKLGVKDYVGPSVTRVSNEVRDAGAAIFALDMDRLAGGCEASDFAKALAEQNTAENDFPGPLPIVWADTVVDEVQLAAAYAGGAAAVTLGLETVGAERCAELRSLAEEAYGLEAIVVCAPRSAGAEGLEALMRTAVDAVGATTIMVGAVSDDDAKAAPGILRDGDDVVLVGRIDAKDDQGLEEAELAWELRDAGYDAVWVSDVLYKFGSFSGSLFAAAPDTVTSVIKAMKSKASTKYARASGAFSGKGEGAKEYLGDILM